jgi:hypothetical protein
MNENLYRQTERTSTDPLGTEAVRTMARAIMQAVGDPNMHPTIPTKVARAVVERRVLPDEIANLCDTIDAKRKSGQLRKPGAYFLSSVRRIFQREEIPW